MRLSKLMILHKITILNWFTTKCVVARGGRNNNWILRFLINGNVTPLTVTYLMDIQHSEFRRYIQVNILLKFDEVLPFICITHVLTTVKNTWHEFLTSLQPQPLNTPLTM